MRPGPARASSPDAGRSRERSRRPANLIDSVQQPRPASYSDPGRRGTCQGHLWAEAWSAPSVCFAAMMVACPRRPPHSICWRRSAPISLARRGQVKALHRPGPGCGRPRASAELASWAWRVEQGGRLREEECRKQIRSWGIAPSYAVVGELQTKGVIERFFRTFKEQVVHGRIYQTIDDVRDAVRTFAVRYNADWLIEKNGHASPSHALATWNQAMLSAAA